jgi:hypothetical protein
VFNQHNSNQEVYSILLAPALTQVKLGFNVTCFAYGMTGAGKTLTMFGNSAERGIADLCVSELKGSKLTASFLEIYNETVRDLLNNTEHALVIQDSMGGVVVPDLQEFAVADSENLHEIIDYGNSRRTVAATLANKTSSRSHAILIFNVTTGNHKAKLQSNKLAVAQT